MLKLHPLPSRAEMNHTPGSSQIVEREQNTSTSLPTLCWGKKKLNMDLQVELEHYTLATTNSLLRLNEQTLEQKCLDLSLGCSIY